MSSPGPGTLYFHSPCFDGITSAVIAAEFLQRHRGWLGVDVKAVSYDLKDRWLAGALARPAAVVDFLYHPSAVFWADHHQTTFLDAATRRDFEQRRSVDLIYDERARSCAGLLQETFAAAGHHNPKHVELVAWANTIDAAQYTSVEDTVIPNTPALRMNASLISATAEYCEHLVQELRKRSLQDVASLPAVRERADATERLLRDGLHRVRDHIRLEADDIVVFDVSGAGAIISRYAPYFFFPGARYSVGVVRGETWAKVTAMRNPWREFPSVALGRIAARYGGGGHARVASVFLPADRVHQASSIQRSIVADIRTQTTSPA